MDFTTRRHTGYFAVRVSPLPEDDTFLVLSINDYGLWHSIRLTREEADQVIDALEAYQTAHQKWLDNSN